MWCEACCAGFNGLVGTTRELETGPVRQSTWVVPGWVWRTPPGRLGRCALKLFYSLLTRTYLMQNEETHER